MNQQIDIKFCEVTKTQNRLIVIEVIVSFPNLFRCHTSFNASALPFMQTVHSQSNQIQLISFLTSKWNGIYCTNWFNFYTIVWKLFSTSNYGKDHRWSSARNFCFHTYIYLRLPDVLERQGLSLNLPSNRVMSLILEKHLVVLEYFPASVKILE